MICFIVIILPNVYSIDNTFADWQTLIHGERTDTGNECLNSVIIGVSSEADIYDAPPSPPPPDFYCNVVIMPPDFIDPLNRDIRAEGDDVYRWIIGVNPKGNLGLPVDVTTKISWTASDFSEGSAILKEGYSGVGETIISDMNAISNFEVTGQNSNQYFVIEYRPKKQKTYDLKDVIYLLQMLSKF